MKLLPTRWSAALAALAMAACTQASPPPASHQETAAPEPLGRNAQTEVASMLTIL